VAHLSRQLGLRDVKLLEKHKVKYFVENDYVTAALYDRMQHGAEPYVLVRRGMNQFRSKFRGMEEATRGTTLYEVIVNGKIVAEVAARTGSYYGSSDRMGARYARWRAQRQVLALLNGTKRVYDQVCSA